MMEENKFYIRILAPMHIGCDEVYDPTGFIINEDTNTLTVFEPMDFFKSLDSNAKSSYATICSKGTLESILELYKFMRGKRFGGRHISVSKGLVAQYKKTLEIRMTDRKKIQQELNNFSISRTSFNPTTQIPYIPGSAVKGALRTSYLNYLAKSKRIVYDRRDKKSGDILEKGLLDYQKLENDPCRLLKISDFHPVGPCKTRIVYAVNAKKVPSKYKARGPYQILEIIEPGAVFTGTIRILKPLAREIIKNPLSENTVFESAAAFYEKERARENLELKEAGLPTFNIDAKDGICCLRLGRHSGAESVTIEGHRNIKIMKKRGERPDHSDKATTFWLSADVSDSSQATELKPFGWVNLGIMTESLQNTLGKMDKTQENVEAMVIPTSRQKEAVPVEVEKPVEEKWDNAFVSYNAGGGGIVEATTKDGNKARLTGKEKAIVIVAEVLHKKLFDGKKKIDKALVTLRKVGNIYEIIKVAPQN
ncbi:MAG TPA: type III-A CRISPR-associated RAMP protein Csm5 [Smithellaceae bacterium]|nr:type III-A CRISPR-associated RAMP protein Csm5 [Smithellaceae bacterium]